MPVGASRPAGQATLNGPEREAKDALDVVRDRPVAIASVDRRHARSEHGPAVERDRRVGGLGEGQSPVTQLGTGADDPRPDAADGHIELLRGDPGERGCDGDAGHVPVHAGTDADGRPDEPRFSKDTERVGHRDGERSARNLDVRDPRPAPEGCADRRDLAVQGAADHRQPVDGRRELPVFLDVVDRHLQRRVRQLHDMRSGIGAEAEPPRQVDVQHVESARPEPEFPRLRVDDDVVVDGDGARQPRIGQARHAVDLEPDEPVVTLPDSRHPPAAEAKRHREPDPRSPA